MKNICSLLAISLVLIGCSKPADQPAPDTTKPTTEKPVTKAETPKQEANLTPATLAEKIDAPLYPGSEAPDQMTRPPVDDKFGGTRYELVLATKDSIDKVAQFYQDKLHLDALARDNGKQLIGKSPKGNDLLIMVGTEAGRTMIRFKAIAYKK